MCSTVGGCYVTRLCEEKEVLFHPRCRAESWNQQALSQCRAHTRTRTHTHTHTHAQHRHTQLLLHSCFFLLLFFFLQPGVVDVNKHSQASNLLPPPVLFFLTLLSLLHEHSLNRNKPNLPTHTHTHILFPLSLTAESCLLACRL